MLCCVSRKASTNSNNKNNENHQNDENHEKSILDTALSSSSSGFSSSSFSSSDNFDSSLTSGFTSSSSSPSVTSGFSSASSPTTHVFPNSSIDSYSTVSQLTDNFLESFDFLANNSSIIHAIAENSSIAKGPLPDEPIKRLQTFSSSPASRSNRVSEDSIVGKESTTKDEPSELLPCTICARTFKQQSLEKHTKICERAAIKKRKPFDSAKQRIHGTELAEFLPKETTKRKIYQPEEKNLTSTNKGSWKQTHDEFLLAIRAARGEPIESTPQRQVVAATNVTVGVPTRPNEKGMCPTCNRQFSIKSYERHVAWCKERAGRVPMSAATNIAKERLEARMRYRAPALKNRRVTNRDKYSPLSAINLPSLTSKSNNATSPSQRAKETASTPNCNNKTGNENTMGNIHSQKSTVNTRRTGQSSREGVSSGPMKSRLSDRSSRPSGEIEAAGTTTSNCPSSRQNSSRSNNNVFHRLSRHSPTRTNFSKSSNSPISTARSIRKNENSANVFDDIDESGEKEINQQDQSTKENVRGSMKNRRQRKNIVHARSHGNPRVNDVTINNDVMGLIVQPCMRKKIVNEEEEFITWKKISEKNLKNIEYLKFNSIGNSEYENEPVKFDQIENEDVIIEDEFDRDGESTVEMENISWMRGIEKLDQTYLIKESLDAEMDFMDIFARKKCRPVIESPRGEFYHDKKQIENNCIGNCEATSANEFQYEISHENSTWWNCEKRKEDVTKYGGKLDEISHLISRRPKLEPLNLTMIENEETPDFIESLRSEKSTKSLRESSRSKLTNNTKKLKPILGNKSTRIELPNYGPCEEKNCQMLRDSNHVDQVELKKNKNENIKILETLRSSKSTTSLENSDGNKLTKISKSIVENESICREPSNFGTHDEENRERRFSNNVAINNDVEKNNDDNIKIFDPLKSSKSAASLKNHREILSTDKMELTLGNESICGSSSFGTYDEVNRERRFSDDVAINNNDNIKIFDPLKSSKSGASLKNHREILSTDKMELTLGNESICGSLSFGTYDEVNREKVFSDDSDREISRDENIKISDTSRALKYAESSKNNYGELLTREIRKIKSINGNESIRNESLNFGPCDEINYNKNESSDLKICNEENIKVPATSRSLKSTAASKTNDEELLTRKMVEMRSNVSNMNFGPSDDKNRANLTNAKSLHNVDLKMVNDEYMKILYTSRSLGSSSFPLNCGVSSTEGTIQYVNYGQSNTREELNETFDEIEKQETSSTGKVVTRASSLPAIEDKSKMDEKIIEIVKNKFSDQIEEFVESSLEKNDEKSVEPGNLIDKTDSEIKIIYQRCGTYVIDKTKNSNVKNKHQISDEFLDEKPLKKKRKTEENGSKKKLKKSSSFENKLEKKTIPTDGKEEEINLMNFNKNFLIDHKKSVKNADIVDDQKIEKNVNGEIYEKYVNRQFNYESDDTLIDDNLFKHYNEPENSSKMEEKNSSGTETFFYEIREKAFSDSYVMKEKMSLESIFLREPEKLQVDDSSEIREKNTRKNNLTCEEEIPELQNCSDGREKSREKKNLEDDFLREQEKLDVQSSSEIRRKLREKMKLLRGSTNNLIKSIETSGNVITNESPSASIESRLTHEIEQETIREIDFGTVGKMAESGKNFCGFLPKIPIDRIIAKNDGKRVEKKFAPLDESSLFWQKATKNSNTRLINLDPPKFHRETRIPCARLSNVGNLPPVVPFGKEKRRVSDRDSRPIWNNYVRRHPDFNLVLTGRTGSCNDYDPFLIAERQMNDLLSDTCSDQSLTDSSSNRRRSTSPTLTPNYPLSHSSAFVKYPDPVTTQIEKLPEKRVSLIAPPTEFDDFSSDSTETNSISREINVDREKNSHENEERKKNCRDHVLGRRVIIDKSKALGTNETIKNSTSNFANLQTNEKARKIIEKTTPKISRSQINRSNSVRLVSVPKVSQGVSNNLVNFPSNKNNGIHNRNNNYASLSGSNVSLSSIVSSEIDVKRSNSMFDELASSFEDDVSGIYPSLRSLLKNDSLSVTSPVQSNRGRNGQISDEEFSSPDSYKRQDHNKLSADSAYSSLNRKYSNHGRSTNDMAGRHEEDSPLRHRDVDSTSSSVARSKMSKFCHECGSKFPDTAKFCCECGIRRLAL